jgi:hypothetical protein
MTKINTKINTTEYKNEKTFLDNIVKNTVFLTIKIEKTKDSLFHKGKTNITVGDYMFSDENENKNHSIVRTFLGYKNKSNGINIISPVVPAIKIYSNKIDNAKYANFLEKEISKFDFINCLKNYYDKHRKNNDGRINIKYN